MENDKLLFYKNLRDNKARYYKIDSKGKLIPQHIQDQGEVRKRTTTTTVESLHKQSQSQSQSQLQSQQMKRRREMIVRMIGENYK